MPIKTQKNLDARRKKLKKAGGEVKTRVLVCSGTGCAASGAFEVYDALVNEAKKAKLNIQVELAPCAGGHDPVLMSTTGCQGFCQVGPLVHILPDDIMYTKVKPSKAGDIVDKTLKGGEVIASLLYRAPGDKKGKEKKGRADIPFYEGQEFVALEGCGHVAAESFDEYVAEGGFLSFSKALSMTPDEVVGEVEKSGLRGRGGGGFPTGRKWRSCIRAGGDERFVICNGDEGDPGAFMDCCIMEGDPYRVLEGMMICARAVGSSKGYIYVRGEYPRAVERLTKAIEACRAEGLLGEKILGSDFDFDIHISRGGGAFVCGESSALMRSIEGNVGEPRAKYIRSVERGLYDKPTVLNNVETYACVPAILREGGEWFAKMGTQKSPGTKAFCLVGKVVNTGLIEVPMGTTLRDVIFGIGGGIIDDRPFKAVQTGGPSGGCLPEEKLDLPVDFDELTKAGSMMGSGGMIVLDDHTCMVDVARYFLEFLLEESCGKCVPCREGIYQLHALIEGLTKGEGNPGDLEKIERLAGDIQVGALCGLGKSAPNPVMSTIGSFREEYETHIKDKKCPAGVCRAITKFYINEKACTGCLLCKKVCPPGAIFGEKKKAHVIDQELCTQCGACRTVCKDNAVETR